MYFSTALAAASLLLHASAFLIPTHLSSAADAAKAQLESLLDTQTQVYELDCPGCPFTAPAGSGREDTQDVENRIHLEFSVDDNQRLCINDEPVFPLALSQSLNLNVVAPQVRTSDLTRSLPVPVGFALEVVPTHTRHRKPGRTRFTARFTVLDLNGNPVDVDTVKIDLLDIQRPSGSSLHIVKVSAESSQGSPDVETCAGSAGWSLCRLRATVNARIAHIIDAAKSRPEQTPGWLRKSGCHGRKHQFGKPSLHGQEGGHRGHEDGHHGHEHHHRHGLHRFGHMLHQALRFFIVPALLGVIGGLMASAVGMLVGQMIVYTWFRFHRNGRCGPLRLAEAVVVQEGERDALMAGKDELPPDYVDVVDEKH